MGKSLVLLVLFFVACPLGIAPEIWKHPQKSIDKNGLCLFKNYKWQSYKNDYRKFSKKISHWETYVYFNLCISYANMRRLQKLLINGIKDSKVDSLNSRLKPKKCKEILSLR